MLVNFLPLNNTILNRFINIENKPHTFCYKFTIVNGKSEHISNKGKWFGLYLFGAADWT